MAVSNGPITLGRGVITFDAELASAEQKGWLNEYRRIGLDGVGANAGPRSPEYAAAIAVQIVDGFEAWGEK
jgi:hypothetical protein